MANSPRDRGRSDDGIDRRTFLRRTGSAALGLGALGMGYPAAAEPGADPSPNIERYKKLGKTGLVVPDVGFGSSGCPGPEVVLHCYDRGMTHFDTAEKYGSGGWGKGDYVENFIGEALHDKRDKVTITTKTVAEADDDRNRIMRKLEQSLRRLRTDYVDVYLNHAVNELDRLKNPEWFEFVERAKQQGKIRFSGMSGHGGRLQECVEYALDHDLVDVILCSHNFGSDPKFYEKLTRSFDWVANQQGMPRLFAKAHEKGVGVVAMKTQMGARLNDLSAYEEQGAAFPEAALRWVFSDPNVDMAIVSMESIELADAYMRASGKSGLRTSDARVLERYVREHTADYCRSACDLCESSCPLDVPVADVLRQRMYASRYGNLPLAQTGYAKLGDGASPCLACSGQPCADACPHGLDISSLTRETAAWLGRS